MLLVLPLYCRIRKEEVLDNFARGRIFEYIRSHPGASYNRIMHEVGVRNGTLVHHLTMLVKHELVIAKRDGIYKRFYPRKVKPPRKPYLSEIQEMILADIESRPGRTQVQIASSLGKPKQIVHYHIRQLSRARFIRRRKEGREFRCYPRT